MALKGVWYNSWRDTAAICWHDSREGKFVIAELAGSSYHLSLTSTSCKLLLKNVLLFTSKIWPLVCCNVERARTEKASWLLMFHRRFHPSSLQDSFGQFAVRGRRAPLIDDSELSKFVHHG